MCTEETDNAKIEENVGNLALLQDEVVSFDVHRWSFITDNGCFYIDACQNLEHKAKGIQDYYICCGCSGRNWPAIESTFNALSINCTLIYPDPSNIIEHTYNNNPDILNKKLRKVLAAYETERTHFHRKANPWSSQTLPSCGGVEAVTAWCSVLCEGKFQKQFSTVCEGMKACDLYSQSLQDLTQLSVDKVDEPSFGLALYSYLHMWQDPARPTNELLKLAAEGLDNISRFTLEEITRLMEEDVSPEIMEEAGEQAELLVKASNMFVQWQHQNNVKPVVFVM